MPAKILGPRRLTKVALLAQQYGGEWCYCGAFSHRWEKVGTPIHVQAVSPGVDQFDNIIPGVEHWLYGDGTPRRVYFGLDRMLTFDLPY